jgi:hypothetical protein
VLLLAGLPSAAPAAAQTSERCFAETGYCISGSIRAYWERNGGLPVFGYPISEQRVETVEDRTIPVQWFERDRLEIQADGTITAGRLGARVLELQWRPWQPGNERLLASPQCRYFPETGYNVCGVAGRFAPACLDTGVLIHWAYSYVSRCWKGFPGRHQSRDVVRYAGTS